MTPDQFTEVALSNVIVKKNIDENARFRPELKRCIDVLSENNEARNEHEVVSAVCKAYDAIIDGIKIFVSYKFETRSAPANLLAPFKHFGANRIKVNDGWPFVAETSVKTGSTWNQDVFESLAQTHWFFQILPEDSADRYWISFEAGYYRGVMRRGVDRLVCIHHPSVELAGPLKVFKGVKGDASLVLSFLRELLCRRDAIPGMEAINISLDDEALRPHAQSITGGLSGVGAVARQYLVKYIDVVLDAQHAPSSIDELLECVVANSSGADRLFEYISSDATGANLKDLVSQLGRFGNANTAWLDQMLKSIKDIYAKSRPETTYSAFRAADGCYYRPQLHAIRRRETDGTIESVHVAFHETVVATMERAPVELDALQTAFQLTYRARWELLEKYGRPRTKADLEMLEHVLRRMEIESEQRDLYRQSVVTPDDLAGSPLVTAFAPERRDEVVQLYSAYGEIRCPESRSGLLDRAFQNGDLKIAREALEKLRNINRAFVMLAADRLAELSKREW